MGGVGAWWVRGRWGMVVKWGGGMVGKWSEWDMVSMWVGVGAWWVSD